MRIGRGSSITGDYQKFLLVTVNVNGAAVTAVEWVVVLGERACESTFTTASPAMSLMVSVAVDFVAVLAIQISA